MLPVHKTTVFFFKSTSKHEKQWKGTGTGRQSVLTARTKTIERTGTAWTKSISLGAFIFHKALEKSVNNLRGGKHKKTFF